jgi:hypothetical protein
MPRPSLRYFSNGSPYLPSHPSKGREIKEITDTKRHPSKKIPKRFGNKRVEAESVISFHPIRV